MLEDEVWGKGMQFAPFQEITTRHGKIDSICVYERYVAVWFKNEDGTLSIYNLLRMIDRENGQRDKRRERYRKKKNIPLDAPLDNRGRPRRGAVPCEQ